MKIVILTFMGGLGHHYFCSKRWKCWHSFYQIQGSYSWGVGVEENHWLIAGYRARVIMMIIVPSCDKTSSSTRGWETWLATREDDLRRRKVPSLRISPVAPTYDDFTEVNWPLVSGMVTNVKLWRNTATIIVKPITHMPWDAFIQLLCLCTFVVWHLTGNEIILRSVN